MNGVQIGYSNEVKYLNFDAHGNCDKQIQIISKYMSSCSKKTKTHIKFSVASHNYLSDLITYCSLLSGGLKRDGKMGMHFNA